MPTKELSTAGFTQAEADVTITERFRQQVHKHPGNIALASGGRKLTYTELDHLANGISESIRGKGKTAEQPVALLCSSKQKQVTSILGALKAGRVWVPLEVSHPFSRNSHIIENSGASTILTDNNGLSAAAKHKSCSLINVDEILPGGKAPDLISDPGDISHVIYTSGSTGEPKGVVHSHGNVMESAYCYTNSFGISTPDRHTLLASLSHSGGITSVFRTLLNGATLLCYDLRAEGLDGLADWLRRERASIYHSIPHVFREFLKHDAGEFPHVRIIQLGGDRISTRDVALYRERFSDRCVLAHVLGATEVGTHSLYLIDKATRLSSSVVPAGYTHGRKQVLILDESRRPVRQGVTGEIAIKSRYLALGYWNEKVATRKSFARADDGERIYYTGDLGYLDERLRLVFLGRKDLQVKINGHRVELLEIEAELLRHSAIDNAAVIAEKTEGGDTGIVAFIAARKAAASHEELRRHLRERLPTYMIPSAIVGVESLPLNDQNKIDREALHRIYTGRHREPDSIAPRSNEEKLVAKIWQEQFPRGEIGIDSNFFSLGGDSLGALQTIIRLNKAYSVKIDFSDIFENPTVEGLSELIQKTRQRLSGT